MSDTNRYDLRISGIGDADGGMYRDVKIDGHGTVVSDMDCISLKVDGLGAFHGNVKAKRGRVSGKSSFSGEVEADEFVVSGYTSIKGNSVIKDFRVDGQTKIDGNVTGEKIEVKGHLKVNGDCNAERFTAKGVFNIGGLLNAGEIDVVAYWKASAREIGGERISIRKGSSGVVARVVKSLFPSLSHFGELTAEVIEGDDIYLEFTRAKIVRGNNVKLGPCCKIDLVEYTGTFETADEANATETRKV